MAISHFKHVLVLADGSPQGARAAELAVHLAKVTGAKLTAVAVIDTMTLRQLLTYRILAAQEMTDFEAELEVSARGYLDRLRSLALDAKVVCEQVLVKGPYHTAVLHQRKQLGADLIVMGAFKSRDASRDLLAREYQKIVDEVPCPVLLVK